ncbi:OmpA family protein [Taibaiella lutea]|uniref:OmpA family protein n=1 Tax=Taibaiella lutea TaxID=2608001 RepID=A0A5M6CEI6_9BACT|nr:OmpA family protein [Taibaiella lutea]KAA5533584.1 OmpA family protein [Taibaiella lutea]
MVKNLILLFLGFLFSIQASAQNFELIQLYYTKDSFKLNNHQRHLLDSVVENFSNRRILIDGHADYNGNENSNNLVSAKRANAVLRYLVDRGFPETQVIHSIGVGQPVETMNKEFKENSKNRRVDIFITKGTLIKSTLKSLPVPDVHTIVKIEPVKKVTEIDYKKLKVGDIITLKNISFVPGTDTVLPASFDELNNLYDILSQHPTLKIKLEGHVCCSLYPDGFFEDTPNWILSVKRALMVKTLLTIKGINPERLSYVGFGHTKPIFQQEIQPDQAQANRRVEIRIMEK